MSRILIVDDDQDLSYLTKVALAQKGYAATICHTVDEAMAELKKRKPDLILMDVMMPGLSGADAVGLLKKEPDFKNIPIIFLTGLISGGDENLEKGGITIDGVVYQTLGKPYEMDDLLKLIRTNLIKK